MPRATERAVIERNPLVLIVDDDPDIRALFEAGLAQEFRVELAADGFAALAKLAPRKPDAILLDMAMPRKSGLAVLNEIRADPKTSRIPVLVVSAVDQDNELWVGIDHQWDMYLQKPVRMEDVVGSLNKLLGRKSKTSARKPAAKKKSAARKSPARKPAARKPAARKPAARKAPARKTAARKPAARARRKR